MSTDSYLIELGLAAKSGQATQLVSQYVPSLAAVNTTPSIFLGEIWEEVNSASPLQNSMRGAVFEILVGLSLVRAGVSPFFRQAEVTYVNNARFDFLLWEEGWNPISISVKTSLRERYKQAELEAGALKNVHRKSENYLVTLEEEEVARRRRQLESSVEFSNLNALVLADSSEFDELIRELGSKVFAKPRDINPMANNLIISG